jgi:hypothetical protein
MRAGAGNGGAITWEPHLSKMMSYVSDIFRRLATRLRRWPHFANAMLGTLLASCAASATAAGGPASPREHSHRPTRAQATAVTLAVELGRPPLARFAPLQAIGGALDGHGEDETPRVYTQANLHAMATAGLGAVSYRLRTELGAQAWHFDPRGSFSEPALEQGYWTGTSVPPRRPARVSWGYELPRRGDTFDQAEDNGYSRIDDGDARTFWKSNPYLDSHFTHEPQWRHPQWVLIDLGRPRAVDELRIEWGTPYATRLVVQRYVGGADAVALAPGHWVDFGEAHTEGLAPLGAAPLRATPVGATPVGATPVGARGELKGRPGTQTVRLSAKALSTRFVRILMLVSSHTAPGGSTDVRDRLGYAIRELYLGTAGRDGALQDELVHSASTRQSTIYTSSTDPWHRAVDIDPGYEQPSFQTVLRSGLTRGVPLLVPVPLLYGTPQNAVAELRYLRTLRVPLRGVELGEEPDGQLISPEDYGALYVQFASAIHRAFPHLQLGGPAFASSLPDWAYWPDAHGDRSWTRRFVSYLRARRALGLLSFFSFEWYPFDNVCAPPGGRLASARRLLDETLAREHGEGIPRRLPVYVTEYGYSAYAGEAEVDMTGALFDADTVGTLLADGVRAAYLYGYEPNVPIRESQGCDTWGNLMLLREVGPGAPPAPLAAFWETQMLTRDWAQPGEGEHVIYPVRLVGAGGAQRGSDATGQRPRRRPSLLHAYAVRRPDGRLSLLLLNLSAERPYEVSVRPQIAGRALPLRGRVQEWQLSSADYRWAAAGEAGRPSLDEPPVHTSWRATGGDARVLLPPYSITVLRSALG